MSVMNVEIIVAVDEMGNVECIPYVPYHSQYTQLSNAFIEAKRNSRIKWQISYLRAVVPVPTDPIIDASVSNTPHNRG